MDYTSIRDNYTHGTVGEFLKEMISGNSTVAIVSAYFTIYAYHQLKYQLNNIERLRFLFGEPSFLRSIDPEKINIKDFKIEDDKLSIPLNRRLEQKSISRECYNWIKEKVDIRSMVEPNFLHGKLYHITQDSGIEKAIVGSSNFTVNGLGLGGKKNIELNMIVDSDRERKELKEWFDTIWNNQTGLVEDVKEEVLKYLKQLYVENEPEFIYFKTLYHLFEDYLDEQKRGKLLEEKTGFYDSEIWNTLYDFQKDGVKGAINKILNHNGCIIADSVGLGKTYEALAIIKYFELLNARVLVVIPKKLSGNWTIFQASKNHRLNPFKRDRFNYNVIYHTDLTRTSGLSQADGTDLEHFNWSAFDLVVIDESHNFRGNPMEKLQKDGTIKMNRAQSLMEKVIKSGVKTKVLMLSATPVNNTLRDLRNQLYFITEGKEDALFETCNIKNIGQTLKDAQRNFTSWAESKNKTKSMKELLEKLDSSFFKLLDELTIARSRKHIKNYYNMERMGSFPKRNKPNSIYPNIDLEGKFPPYDQINKKILEYKLSIFNPSAYVKPEKQEEYENLAGTEVLSFKQSDRENWLIGMMKINYLKRLESSIESFEISLERTIQKIINLEKKIGTFLKEKKFNENKAMEETLENFVPDQEELEEDGDDIDQWQVGKKLKFNLADLELGKWQKDLEKDKDALSILLNNAKAVTPDKDAKLKELKRLISEKIHSPLNEDNKKIIIFTAFTDTARYLYANIREWYTNEFKLHCALISGNYTQTTFGENDYEDIVVNFSPVSKNRSQMTSLHQAEEIDLLIATDCISEGQNLQDCDYLINYDIHWNPVRIIQRFGRIDRLGSINKTIQLVNFWPTKDLDSYINLKERVESRMALVDVTATGEDNILNTDQLTNLITEDLKYRNKQLKKLQNEVLDLEEMDETISLTDFTLDDFRIELLNYIGEHRNKLNDSPMGLYAVVPAPGGDHSDLLNHKEISATEKKIITPGVIFCLAQKGECEGNEAVNPLSPYFLVYIREDGTVRYNYTNAKQILEIYRLLCQGQKRAYDTLCALFNQETANGEDMDKYSDLLKKAVNEIVHIFKKKSFVKLTTGREVVLIPQSQQIKELNDFELITWLILR